MKQSIKTVATYIKDCGKTNKNATSTGIPLRKNKNIAHSQRAAAYNPL